MCACCPSVWHLSKLFTFSSFSPEPPGQFQPSILGWREFKFDMFIWMDMLVFFKAGGGGYWKDWLNSSFGKFVQMTPAVRCPHLFSPISLKLLGHFQQNLAQSIIGWRELKCLQIKGYFNSKKGELRNFMLVQIKVHAHQYKGKIITEFTTVKNLFVQNHWANFNRS